MDDDLFEIPAPVDYETGDGSYLRKPRLKAGPRRVPSGLIGLTVLAVCVALGVLIVRFGMRSEQTPEARPAGAVPAISALPGDLPSQITEALASSLPRADSCVYTGPDRRTSMALPTPAPRVPGRPPRLVLDTNLGRIIFVFNGQVGRCTEDAILALAATQAYDNRRCAPVPRSHALRCRTASGLHSRPFMPMSYTGTVTGYTDENGNLTLDDPASLLASPPPAGLRDGLVALVVDPDGQAGADLILAYATTELPAGAYPQLGEIEDGDAVLDRAAEGLTITTVTVV